MRIRTRLNAITLLGVCCMATPAFAASVQRYEAIAYDADNREIYRETHWLSDDAGARELTVLFRCPDGTPFARKRVREAGSPQAPLFELEDQRSGYREGVRADSDGRRSVYVQRSADEPEKNATLIEQPGIVIDVGIDTFIHAHWETLTSGTAQTMEFLVPSRLRTFKFQVSRVDSAATDRASTQRFRLEIDAWFAFIVPAIDMVYDADTRTLREYFGIANVRDASGRSLTVHIEFPTATRLPATAADVAEAVDAPLDGRCRL